MNYRLARRGSAADRAGVMGNHLPACFERGIRFGRRNAAVSD
jgi:hypothetical protein